jgi:hypothetical protein
MAASALYLAMSCGGRRAGTQWGEGGKDFLETVSYVYLPWELTYPRTYHPVLNIFKLFILILSVFLLYSLTYYTIIKGPILSHTLPELTFTQHS